MKEEKAKRGKRKDSIKIGIKRRRLKFKQNVSNLLSSHHSPHYLTTNEWLMTLSAFITSNHSSHPSQPHFLSASFLSSSISFEKEFKKRLRQPRMTMTTTMLFFFARERRPFLLFSSLVAFPSISRILHSTSLTLNEWKRWRWWWSCAYTKTCLFSYYYCGTLYNLLFASFLCLCALTLNTSDELRCKILNESGFVKNAGNIMHMELFERKSWPSSLFIFCVFQLL